MKIMCRLIGHKKKLDTVHFDINGFHKKYRCKRCNTKLN